MLRSVVVDRRALEIYFQLPGIVVVAVCTAGRDETAKKQVVSAGVGVGTRLA